jgi:hypothetical protein
MTVQGIGAPSFSGLNGGGLGGLGAASLISSVGGLFSSAIGGFFSAKVNKYNLQAQAITADTNARIAELGAQSALMQGQQEVGKLTFKAGQLKSSQRVALAANGVDLGEGSAAEIQASTDIMKEVDANTILANSVRNAWGYRMQGTNFTNQALTARNNASAISPWMDATGTLLGGAGKVASSWYQMNAIGALKNTPFAVGGMN